MKYLCTLILILSATNAQARTLSDYLRSPGAPSAYTLGIAPQDASQWAEIHEVAPNLLFIKTENYQDHTTCWHYLRIKRSSPGLVYLGNQKSTVCAR